MGIAACFEVKQPLGQLAVTHASIRRKPSFGMAVALVLWLGAVSGATILMARYSKIPGGGGAAPVSWPSDTQIPRDPSEWTLVMFAHPRCPCTRASLGELERLLAQVPHQPSVHIIFLKPVATAPDWEKTDLWRGASAIPGVTIHTDNAGSEARRFHVETSGETLLYAPDGRLRFHGGITLGRGHEGDNPGRSALQELLRQGKSKQNSTPVFGCSLFETQCQTTSTLCKP
jgi:hypothetical protein